MRNLTCVLLVTLSLSAVAEMNAFNRAPVAFVAKAVPVKDTPSVDLASAKLSSK